MSGSNQQRREEMVWQQPIEEGRDGQAATNREGRDGLTAATNRGGKR